MEYTGYSIEVFEREPGRWRASIRRLDGSKVHVGSERLDFYTTSVDTTTADQALEHARNVIDAGAVA
jgi:hypothetical protein